MQYIIKNFRRNTFTVDCNEAVVESKGIDLSKSSYRFRVRRQIWFQQSHVCRCL